MTTKVVIGNAELWQGDCLEYMCTLPDKAFDLAIVDPPYGLKQQTGQDKQQSKLAHAPTYKPFAGGDKKPPSKEYFIELRRVSVNQIIWGANHFAGLFDSSSSCWIVWDKHASGGFADCELAYTSFKTAVRKFDYPWNGMIQGYHGNKALNEKRIHPTQKPVKLYEWLLTNYAKLGDRILDTHLGSGSSAIAANNLGFEFVGCELDGDYYQAAVNRTQAIQVQPRLELSA